MASASLAPSGRSESVAIVTGGSGGIGLAIGCELARRGVRHIVFAQRGDAKPACDAVRALGSRADALHLDVSSRAGVVAFFVAFEAAFGCGGLDYLVNCSGACPKTPIDEVTEDEMRATLAVNVEGPFWMCQLARPLMWNSGGGAIVNVSSLAGEDGAVFASISYTIAKAGMRGMAMQLAKCGFPPEASAPGAERRDFPCVRVNNVAPGPVDTAMIADVSAATLRSMSAATLTDRLTTPEEVARATAFLLLDATNMTGQTLQLSGGAIRR